jgi:RNA polymerase sigma factor (sigma-70 family)
MPAPSDPEELLLDHLAWISRMAGLLGRRHGFDADEIDDFRAWSTARLVADDYLVLRKFRGESSITTYLSVVISMLFRDYRIALRGRFRNSAVARRLGPVASRLETLIYRDGFTVEQAIQTLRSSGVTDLNDRALKQLASTLPQPRGRPIQVESELSDLYANDVTDQNVVFLDEARTAQSVRLALAEALAELSPQDQVILRLRFWHGKTITQVAKTLEVGPAYIRHRIRRQLNQLKKRLKTRGVDREALTTPSAAWDFEAPLVTVAADLTRVPPDVVTEFMAALDELHRAHGGGGLRILGAFSGSALAEAVPV